MTVTNTRNVAGVGAAFPAGQAVPTWFNVTITGTMPNFQVRLSPNSFTPAGHYTATLLLGTGDANAAVLSSSQVPVTMDVIAPVSVNSAPFNANFVFGADVSSATFSRNVDANQGTWTVTADVPWITVPAGTGPLVFLPDVPLSGISYPEAIASTWDDRILYGLAFAADEAEDNLLILDGNGGSIGSASSGPNNGGRHRGNLAVSGDLFRVVSTHVVPNGTNPSVSYVVSFYNLQ